MGIILQVEFLDVSKDRRMDFKGFFCIQDRHLALQGLCEGGAFTLFISGSFLSG